MRLGQRVRHGKFGDGVVQSVRARARMHASKSILRPAGTKWLVISYANLELM